MSLRIPSPVALTKPEAYLAYKAGILSRGELKDKLLNPINNYEGWLAKWCELLETYPTNEDGTPQCLTDEEGLLAYLCGVTDRYPATNSRPDDARISAYIRYLVSARYARPDHPLNREEFYLSLIKTQFIPSGNPSSDIVIDGTTKAPFVDVKVYGDSYQQTYSGKNLFDIAQVNNLALGETIAQQSTYRGYTLKVSVGQTYTISRASASTPNRFRICFTGVEPAVGVDYYNSQGVRKAYDGNESMTSVTVTVPSGMEYLFVYLSNSNDTITEAMQIQIEQSATKTDYEPYVGGIPAPNPSYPQPISVVTGENVVKVTGKNLFNTSTATLVNKYANTNGDIVSAPDWTGIDSFFAVQPNTTYTFSAENQGARFLWNEYTSASGSTFISPRHESTGTFTTGSSTHYIRFSTNNANATDLQIELGSTATAYEPYTAQDYEVNLGKNLVNPTLNSGSHNGITRTVNADGSIHVSGTATADESWRIAGVVLEVGQTYTLSGCPSGGSSTTWQLYTNVLAPQFIDYGAGATKTITSGSGGVYFIIRSGATIDATIYPQLEKGSKATSFAPYFTPLELAKIGTYQDRIYKDEGKWYIEKQVGKVVLIGANSENWQYANGVCYTDSITDYSRSNNKPLSDNFTTTVNVASAGSVADNTSAFGAANLGTQNRFYVKYTSLFTSAATIKTWLTSHPTTVYYALATPTTTEITNQSLIDQLNALKQGGAEEGTTYIRVSATDPNLPAKLYVEAPKYD